MYVAGALVFAALLLLPVPGRAVTVAGGVWKVVELGIETVLVMSYPMVVVRLAEHADLPSVSATALDCSIVEVVIDESSGIAISSAALFRLRSLKYFGVHVEVTVIVVA